MASVDLDNIQFYFPPPSPPGYRPSNPVMARASADILMLNSSDRTALSTAPVPVTTPSPEQPHPLEIENLDYLPPFHHAPASPPRRKKQESMPPPWVISKDFSQVLEAFGIAEIETVDLTGDDPISPASLPSMSLPPLEGPLLLSHLFLSLALSSVYPD